MKSKNRQLLEADKDYLFWLFDARCAKCGQHTRVVLHEIVPISHGRVALAITNRIALCDKCHDWAHRVGTNISIPILQALRKKVVDRKWEQLENGKNQEAHKQE